MFFFFQAEDGIRYGHVTGVQTCALPISAAGGASRVRAMLLTDPLAWRAVRYTVSCGPSTAATRSTGPSTGRTTDKACGPMSHSPPLSRRHGEAPYGLPGWKIDANIVTRAPSHSPASAVARRNASTLA